MIKATQEGREYPNKKPHPRALGLYKKQIIKPIREKLTGAPIHKELQGMGVKVGYSTVEDYLSKTKKKRKYIYKSPRISSRKSAGRFWQGNSVFCLFCASVFLGSNHLFWNVSLRYGLSLEMRLN